MATTPGNPIGDPGDPERVASSTKINHILFTLQRLEKAIALPTDRTHNP